MARIDYHDGGAAEIHIPAAGGEWQESGVDGLQIKTLWVDRRDGASVCLLKYAAGTRMPRRHVHASNQMMFCLEGRYSYDGGPTLHPGDFYLNKRDNPHGPAVAERDTVLLEIYDGPHYYEDPEFLVPAMGGTKR
ncbi:MAG TPA: cupin domain-containing protein [Glycomyces sp.]|nr:cupin domain-containing protein [Glycomyces sp.]